MRSALLALCVLAGCAIYGDDGPTDDGPEGLSCQLDRTAPERYFQPIDLLVVLDRSPLMAAYDDALTYNLPRFASVLENIEGGLPDLRIGLVSADLGGDAEGCSETGDGGALLAPPDAAGCPADPVLVHERLDWWRCGADRSAVCGEVNYDGSFADALACTVDRGTGSCTVRKPLAAAASALTSFRRPEALTMILFISAGDDSSPGGVGGYADALLSVVDDPYALAVSIIAPDSAARLHAFAELFPQRNTVTSIDADDWSDSLVLLAEALRQLLGYPCLSDLDPTDVDPANPGLQPECVVTDDETGAQLPACRMAAPGQPAADIEGPCWWVEPDPWGDELCGHVPHLVDARWARWQCVAICY